MKIFDIFKEKLKKDLDKTNYNKKIAKKKINQMINRLQKKDNK